MVKDFDGDELGTDDLMLVARTAMALLARERGLLTEAQAAELLDLTLPDMEEVAQDMAEQSREAWEQHFGGPPGAA